MSISTCKRCRRQVRAEGPGPHVCVACLPAAQAEALEMMSREVPNLVKAGISKGFRDALEAAAQRAELRCLDGLAREIRSLPVPEVPL